MTRRGLVGREDRLDPISAAMAQAPLGTAPDAPDPTVLGFLTCAVVLRPAAYRQVGGFAERLGMYGEEALLAMNLAAAGWRLAYVPELVAHHLPAPTGRDPRAPAADRGAQPGAHRRNAPARPGGARDGRRGLARPGRPGRAGRRGPAAGPGAAAPAPAAGAGGGGPDRAGPHRSRPAHHGAARGSVGPRRPAPPPGGESLAPKARIHSTHRKPGER
ncbi:hypothetical protein OG799_10280 [Micromonospora sp. NBC_00898]|uniref:hypothetical protein n=1 Tax=Micromonospora sp. NBC_00898 TaxID=2975981 RepID=UPI00386C1DE8|nr:hypothetical protein OG799_10280 [Micromonospora sp. NBC_00898]